MLETKRRAAGLVSIPWVLHVCLCLAGLPRLRGAVLRNADLVPQLRLIPAGQQTG